MSDQLSIGCTNSDNSESSLHRILKNCAKFQSSESLLIDEDFNDVCAYSIYDYYKMISTANSYSPASANSGSSSTSSNYASDESFGENILEENGRISLAYENLRTIPKRIAEKFAAHTKCLDLSYNNFQNLSFLSFFEELHTLILDRNNRLDANTLPFLPNLKILWINNCEINNIADWIQRIQMQCPTLEHLSIMGNPGINSQFNFCTLPTSLSSNLNNNNESLSPTFIMNDYREYIYQVLPSLEYLDGVPTPTAESLHALSSRHQHFNNHLKKTSSTTTTTTTSSSIGLKRVNNNCTTSTDNRQQRVSNSCNQHHQYNQNGIKNSSPLNTVKELFRFPRRRKKSYQSSSTN